MVARARLWGLFLVLVLLTGAALTASGWLATAGGLPVWLGLAVGLFVAVAVQAIVWAILDWSIIRPSTAIARDVDLLLHANPELAVAVPAGHGLGPLPAAVGRLAAQWRASRAAQEAALAEATAAMRVQQSQLEALLRDLSDGVIACSADRRILLFNDAARRILGAPPTLGLHRTLDRLIAREPITHTFAALSEPAAGGADAPDAARTEFVCATADGSLLLRCRMALILATDGDDRAGKVTGFVLDFADATADLADEDVRHARLARLITELRAPIANLRAAAEVLAGAPELEPAARVGFVDVVAEECGNLSERIEDLCAASEQLLADPWPTVDLFSGDLVRWVNRRLQGGAVGPALVAVGDGLWLAGDGFHLTLLLAALAEHVAAVTGARELDLEVHEYRTQTGEARVALDLVWDGAGLSEGTLHRWRDQAIDTAGTTPGVVLNRHGSDLWSQGHQRAGRSLVRIPLPAPARAQVGGPAGARERLPPRPEFYDFALLERSQADARPLLDQPLGELAYVAFDTETTGLDPAGGDRVIQIAGARIVNRRLLTGEVFDALIDPGRPIPKGSIRFHGITDDMVAGRPPVEIVLPQFHGFAGDAVLVAHNAAFDMAFLRRDQGRAGVTFDQPVLDTLLLSAVLHDHTPEHSLDAIAARFGITLTDRHRALGDALGTARLFLRLLDLLESQGVTTLRQAIDFSDRAASVRRRQEREFGDAAGTPERADHA